MFTSGDTRFHTLTQARHPSHFHVTRGGEEVHGILVVNLPQAVEQEVQGAGAVRQPGQEAAPGAARGAQHLERAAGQLALTAGR